MMILRLDRMGHGPQAVGRAESGKVVLVRGGAPGDQVSIRIEREHRRHDEAVIDAVLEPGPGRREAPCVHARSGDCGGCDWQHLDEATQRAEKQAFVEREVLRVDPGATVRPIRSDVPPFGYRRRTRLGYRDGIIGFRRPRERRIFDLRSCPVLHPEIDAALDAIRDAFKDAESGNVDVFFDGEDVIVGGEARAFRQPAAEGEAALVEMVLEAIPADAAHIAELFCGAGTFTLPLVQRGHARIRAWEVGRQSIDALRKSAPSVEAFRADLLRNPIDPPLERPDVVLLDPPRGGALPCMSAVLEASPAVVAYVSCSPMTLCRDARELVAGGYGVDWVQALDAFPQTHHVETVMRLSRRTDHDR